MFDDIEPYEYKGTWFDKFLIAIIILCMVGVPVFVVFALLYWMPTVD